MKIPWRPGTSLLIYRLPEHFEANPGALARQIGTILGVSSLVKRLNNSFQFEIMFHLSLSYAFSNNFGKIGAWARKTHKQIHNSRDLGILTNCLNSQVIWIHKERKHLKTKAINEKMSTAEKWSYILGVAQKKPLKFRRISFPKSGYTKWQH